MNSYLKKIMRVITNPIDFYYHRIQPLKRHKKYPQCHPTSIVYKPLKFNPAYVTLEESVYIFKFGRISCVTEYAGEKFSPSLVFGAHTTIQQNSHITCAGKVLIGKWCAITHNVTITDIDHTYEYGPTYKYPPIHSRLKVGNIKIGDYCMIFPNVVILGGTEIGERCVIAANAVVRGSFPPHCLIGGIPAKIIKRYNSSTRKWEKTNPDGSFKE